MTDPVVERCSTCTGSDEIAAQLPRPTRSASVASHAERINRKCSSQPISQCKPCKLLVVKRKKTKTRSIIFKEETKSALAGFDAGPLS